MEWTIYSLFLLNSIIKRDKHLLFSPSSLQHNQNKIYSLFTFCVHSTTQLYNLSEVHTLSLSLSFSLSLSTNLNPFSSPKPSTLSNRNAFPSTCSSLSRCPNSHALSNSRHYWWVLLPISSYTSKQRFRVFLFLLFLGPCRKCSEKKLIFFCWFFTDCWRGVYRVLIGCYFMMWINSFGNFVKLDTSTLMYS